MVYAIGKKFIWLYYSIFYKITVEGLENIPSDTRGILCANHISLQDPLLLLANVKRPISFLSKDELSRNFVTKAFFNAVHTIPVKRGKMDMKALREAVKVLEEDKLLGVFIQGTRVIGEADVGAKSGAVLFAQRSGAPLIPVYIEGNYKLFSKMLIRIGRPRNMEKYKKRKMNSEELGVIADELMEEIYALATH